MKKVKSARILSIAALLVVTSMVIPICTPWALAAQTGGPVTSILIFPFENTTTAGGPELGQSVAVATKSSLGANASYAVSLFNAKTPSIQRAQSEKRVTLEDLKAPYDSDKALKLGAELGAQLVLLGTIDDYKYDDAAKQVDLTITGQIYSIRTKEVLNTVAFTGTAKATADEDESMLAKRAAEDWVSKATKSLGGSEVKSSGKVGKSDKKTASKATKKKHRFLFIRW